ncbi:Uncharacterized protein dnl_51200 [Desulfonema limicola]|uniref:Uncharacterized protein n=1 Tax=Desulfonema limicola TaxID=45656 RepID=A0A975GJ81_9BACT|nr:hypothetical protein [Desulfonema limicola]QTA82738.1 Uncharacterized protein dnl_51200 [Desulfonema limicola]
MNKSKIFIKLSNDIQKVISESSLSISDILEASKIDANIEYGVLPESSNKGSRTKDVVPIILAGSGAVLSISLAISQILNTLYSKPHFVECLLEKKIKDKNGKIIKSEFVKTFKFIEPSKKERIKVLDMKAGNIVLHFSSTEKPQIIDSKKK